MVGRPAISTTGPNANVQTGHWLVRGPGGAVDAVSKPNGSGAGVLPAGMVLRLSSPARRLCHDRETEGWNAGITVLRSPVGRLLQEIPEHGLRTILREARSRTPIGSDGPAAIVISVARRFSGDVDLR